MDILFKRLSLDDVTLLQHEADDVFDHCVDLEASKRFLGDPRNLLVVALVDDLVIGQIQAVVHEHLDAPPDLFIDNLGVAPAWRRRGVARRLISLALQSGRLFGAEEAWVLTEQDNHAAQAAYASAGATARTTLMFSFQGCA
ncbi:MAG: GNAT family N-acetyltransferase [Parvularculaceae bacterium]|nr:GNAT family N-acetyltransferase [Parvularculaceae bacterium]